MTRGNLAHILVWNVKPPIFWASYGPALPSSLTDANNSDNHNSISGNSKRVLRALFINCHSTGARKSAREVNGSFVKGPEARRKNIRLPCFREKEGLAQIFRRAKFPEPSRQGASPAKATRFPSGSLTMKLRAPQGSVRRVWWNAMPAARNSKNKALGSISVTVADRASGSRERNWLSNTGPLTRRRFRRAPPRAT
jgi:hypothetical protein